MAFLYQGFATVYDRLMSDVPYAKFAAVFDAVVQRSGDAPVSVIDLGCGTGAMFPHLLRRASRVIGVDASEEMLARAALRTNGDPRVSLLQQRAEQFRIPGQTEWCVSFCDVLNYMEDDEALRQAFRSVYRALRPGGHFLFDLLSRRYLEMSVGSGAYFEVDDDAAYLMQSTWDAHTQSVSYDLVVFARESGRCYARYDERHVQRAFAEHRVREALAEAGFVDVAVGGDVASLASGEFKADLPSGEQPDRWFFLARRPGLASGDRSMPSE